ESSMEWVLRGRAPMALGAIGGASMALGTIREEPKVLNAPGEVTGAACEAGLGLQVLVKD
ncbi:unnamed protein product, partial [Ilex paraguariensis]